jgi:hypothetical protein
MATQPNVILRGGPALELAEAERLCHVSTLVDKIKLLRGHRYEHFERSSDMWTQPDGHELHVYNWTGFTRVAE